MATAVAAKLGMKVDTLAASIGSCPFGITDVEFAVVVVGVATVCIGLNCDVCNTGIGCCGRWMVLETSPRGPVVDTIETGMA